MSKTFERVALFKVSKEEDRNRLVEQFKELKNTAVKDGKPYILSIQVGHIVESPVSRGFTFAVRVSFASQADMVYYGTQDPAHKKVIEIMEAPGVKEDVLGVTFLGELDIVVELPM